MGRRRGVHRPRLVRSRASRRPSHTATSTRRRCPSRSGYKLGSPHFCMQHVLAPSKRPPSSVPFPIGVCRSPPFALYAIRCVIMFFQRKETFYREGPHTAYLPSIFCSGVFRTRSLVFCKRETESQDVVREGGKGREGEREKGGEDADREGGRQMERGKGAGREMRDRQLCCCSRIGSGLLSLISYSV